MEPVGVLSWLGVLILVLVVLAIITLTVAAIVLAVRQVKADRDL